MTEITLTIRLIRSFTYRTIKNIIIKTETTATPIELKKLINAKISSTAALKPYANHKFDTLKIYTKAFGSKTQNLVVNFNHEDEWYLKDEISLGEQGVENETEISFFNHEEYESYKLDPSNKW